MPLPINKQPVVRPGSKMTSFGWPFHGKVTDAGDTGSLPLDPPASPSTKTFTAIRELVVGADTVGRWYRDWNVTNTTKIQRPGWTVPPRSAEQLTSDDNHGHKWKPYMTFVGPRNRMSGADSPTQLGWNSWIYIDSLGAAYLISFTNSVLSSTELEFTFTIAELVVTVTRDPDERLVVETLDTSPLTFFTDFFKMVIMDRTPTGDKVLLHRVAGVVSVFWDTSTDLPRVSIGEANSDFEIQVTGDGIDNIAFTINKDPFDEKDASFVPGSGANTTQSEIIAFFYDDAGVRQPVTFTTVSTATGGAPTPGGAVWESTLTTTVDWGGLYSSVRFENTSQTGPTSPFTQKRFVESVEVDSATGTNPVRYDNTLDVFVIPGGTPSPVTARTLTAPWLAARGERVVRIAQGFMVPTDIPTSSQVIEDVWLDKKNGNIVSSLSGWDGGFTTTGFFELVAYDPETGAFDSVVFSSTGFPDWPNAFDLKWYV